MLMNKLPQDLRILMSRGIKNDNWDLDRLLELLEAEVEARERATSNRGTGGNNLHRNQQPKLQGRTTLWCSFTDGVALQLLVHIAKVHIPLIVVKLFPMP